MTDRRVIVTGATGLIGSRAVAALSDRGFDVHAVARSRPRETGGATWHEVDLLADDARGSLVAELAPTHLLHLAWYAEHGAFWQAAVNADWVAATVRLAGEFAAAGGARAVFAGSCAEYDWTTGAEVLLEASPVVPSTFYGICKDAARRVVEAIGPSTAWGRVFFLYGPGEDPRRLVASVARALANAQRASTSSGTQIRDLLHADDVAEAFVALLDSEIEGTVNIGSGQGVTIRHVVEQIAAALDRDDLLDIGGFPDRPGDPPVLVPDVSRLRGEVGWTPRIQLEEGLRRTAAWWTPA